IQIPSVITPPSHGVEPDHARRTPRATGLALLGTAPHAPILDSPLRTAALVVVALVASNVRVMPRAVVGVVERSSLATAAGAESVIQIVSVIKDGGRMGCGHGFHTSARGSFVFASQSARRPLISSRRTKRGSSIAKSLIDHLDANPLSGDMRTQ